MHPRCTVTPFTTADGWVLDGEGVKTLDGRPVAIESDREYADLIRTSGIGRKIINAVGDALQEPIDRAEPWRWASTFIIGYIAAEPGSDKRDEYGFALVALMKEALAVIERKDEWSIDDVALYHAAVTYAEAARPKQSPSPAQS